nr:hypothetical protein [Tanacetum cinerariifolium]
TMDTIVDQQVAIDKALVPTAQCLRIRKSNFLLLSDIKSKESTLQLLWRSFAALINKCLTGKSSGYDSLRLSQAQILWGLYHKRNVDYAYLMWEDFVYQVEHKNQKKSNEMYYPRFIKSIIHHFMSKDPLIPRRNKVNWHNVRDDFMFSMIKLAYKEYYSIATGEAAPKPKASVRRTRSSSDTSITLPTAAASPRLKASAKGKQTTHISQPSGSCADEGTDDEGDDNKEQDDDGDEEDEGDDGEEGNVEERFAFNVYLRMFTRSIIIQQRMEDLQLGVESYQKRLNLTKPDTYRSDLKHKEAYTAYSNPRGFIYQNKEKKNRLMRIDELHKFSDGTLTDVGTALDDRLKGIRMRYLPQTIWWKSDKDRAVAMIQAIVKRLKTRRIMRSLEKFVGGRLYEGDFRMLQRTI